MVMVMVVVVPRVVVVVADETMVMATIINKTGRIA
jgi:hypothetical protein